MVGDNCILMLSNESLDEYCIRINTYDLEKLQRLYSGEVNRYPDDNRYKEILDAVTRAINMKTGT